MAEKIEIFICYAHKDESLMRELESHLKPLVRQGDIMLWHDRNVAAGSDWKQEVHKHLDSARIILLLVSANFLASDYSYTEVERAMERSKAGEAQVIPIILRPVNWRSSLFGKLTPLPRDGRPITSSTWHNHDEAFFDVVEGIEKIIESIKPALAENSPSQLLVKEPALAKETPPMFQEQQKFDVFLCYTSADRDAVKQIGEELKKHGVRPWLDVWELRPGLPWQRALEKQIDEIKTAAVFVGKGGIGPWQQMEMEAFLREFVKHGSPVIPVLLPDAPEKPVLPVFLRGMHWVNFREQDPDPMGQLILGITGRRVEGEDAKELPGDVAMPPPTPMSQTTQSAQPLISSRRQDLLKRRERLYKNIAYYEEEYDNTAGAKARLEIEREIERQKKVLQEVEDELGGVE